jgi:hypothetical protein
VPETPTDLPLAERIEADGLTMMYRPTNTPAWAVEGSRAWQCTIEGFGRSLDVPVFAMGPALTGDPSVADVLEVTLSDTAGYRNADGYHDWLSEFGMDDDKPARQTYKSVGKQADRVRAFFGEHEDDYLWHTER